MIRVYFFEMAILYCYMLDPAVDQSSLDLPTMHRFILNISIWNLNKWNILSHSWGPQNVLAMLDRSDMTGRSNWKSRCCTCHFSCELACGRFWATVLTCFDLGLCFLFFSESAGHPNLCLTFVPFRSEANPAEAQSHGRGFWFLWYGYGPKMKTIHFSVSIMWPCQGNLSLDWFNPNNRLATSNLFRTWRIVGHALKWVVQIVESDLHCRTMSSQRESYHHQICGYLDPQCWRIHKQDGSQNTQFHPTDVFFPVEGGYGLVDKTHPSCVRPGFNTRVQH